jgi:hypothetical protein
MLAQALLCIAVFCPAWSVLILALVYVVPVFVDAAAEAVDAWREGALEEAAAEAEAEASALEAG